MRISIGILAWNEAEVIGTALESLLAQSLLQETGKHRVEVIVVPNGCSDSTAALSRRTLEAATRSADQILWRVQELPEPGKANAWNQFVHQFSDPAAEVLFLMDADIRFAQPDTLERMLQTLQQHPEATIVTDLPLKHVLFKQHRTLVDRISLAIGRTTQVSPAQITGQLYGARGAPLRRIHLPRGLIADDGFIKHMICTDGFTHPTDPRRVVRAPGASHVFEAYTRIRDVFNNQRRQQVAQTIYGFLRDYLRERIPAQDAGRILEENNRRDPDWFLSLIRERVAGGGRWVMYPGAFSVRFRRLKNFSRLQALKHAPVAVLGFLLDVAVLVAANRRLRRDHLGGIWQDTRSSALAQTRIPEEASSANEGTSRTMSE